MAFPRPVDIIEFDGTIKPLENANLRLPSVLLKTIIYFEGNHKYIAIDPHIRYLKVNEMDMLGQYRLYPKHGILNLRTAIDTEYDGKIYLNVRANKVGRFHIILEYVLDEYERSFHEKLKLLKKMSEGLYYSGLSYEG